MTCNPGYECIDTCEVQIGYKCIGKHGYNFFLVSCVRNSPMFAVNFLVTMQLLQLFTVT